MEQQQFQKKRPQPQQQPQKPYIDSGALQQLQQLYGIYPTTQPTTIRVPTFQQQASAEPTSMYLMFDPYADDQNNKKQSPKFVQRNLKSKAKITADLMDVDLD